MGLILNWPLSIFPSSFNNLHNFRCFVQSLVVFCSLICSFVFFCFVLSTEKPILSFPYNSVQNSITIVCLNGRAEEKVWVKINVSLGSPLHVWEWLRLIFFLWVLSYIYYLPGKCHNCWIIRILSFSVINVFSWHVLSCTNLKYLERQVILRECRNVKANK